MRASRADRAFDRFLQTPKADYLFDLIDASIQRIYETSALSVDTKFEDWKQGSFYESLRNDLFLAVRDCFYGEITPQQRKHRRLPTRSPRCPRSARH